MMRKAAESRRWSMTSPPQKKRGIALLKRFKGRRQMEKTEKPKVERPGIEEKKGRKGPGHTAEEKCRAVLSVWTERRKPGEVCRELGVAWSLLSQWQERAMEGMFWELRDGGEGTAAQEGEGAETRTGTGAGDPAGAWWNLNGKAGSSALGGVAQNVLRVGGKVAKNHGPGVGER